MNKCRMIHETVLKDIMDLWDDVKNLTNSDVDQLLKTKSDAKNPMRGMSSIAKATSNMTLVFPVICSRGIAIENASMVSKAVEKNAVTMLQRLFSAYQLSDERDVASFLSKFHQNISSGAASLDDVFNLATRLTEASALEKAAVKEDMRNLDFYLPSPVSESALTRYIVREGAATPNGPANNNSRTYNGPFHNDNSNTYNGAVNNVRGGINHNNYHGTVNDVKGGMKNYHGTVHDVKGTNNNYYGNITNINGPDPNSPEERAARSAKHMSDARKADNEFFNNQVVNSDYKKANELMPTLMTVNFKVETDNGNIVDYNNALIGVKAKLYPVSSEDVVNHLADKTISRNWLTNFFRATTREISFMKDFILAIDKAKIDALSLSTRRSTSDKMWKVLERRALNSRLKNVMRQNNNAAAITTLCISQEEVEYIRKYYNVDMERVSTILGLFESLNLMCVCIVDESLEVAKFIYDEREPMWETISFTHLEREASDNTYKRVVNLMTKMSR